MVAHAEHECCLGGLLKGGMSMNLTPGKHVLLLDRVVWLVVGCGVLAWLLLCWLWCLVRRPLGLLERIMAGMGTTDMFGALLGFEATSLLTGTALWWVVVVGAWCFGVCPVSAARWSLV